MTTGIDYCETPLKKLFRGLVFVMNELYNARFAEHSGQSGLPSLLYRFNVQFKEAIKCPS